MKETMTFERREAVLLTVEFDGSVEEYAMAWLKLTNNAREYSSTVWKIWNGRDNKVYVICNPKSAENVKDFCTGIVGFYHEDEKKMHYIGKVVSQEDITVGVPIYDWESSYAYEDPRWEEDFNKGIRNWIGVINGC